MPSDSSLSESHISTYIHTLNSMLDQIKIPSDLQPLDLDFVTINYADWMSHDTSGIPTSKLGLLCTSGFQSIAGHGLGNEFIRSFRFLLWTTSLFYTATSKITGSNDGSAYATALCNLEELISCCGNRVVRRLDQYCHPGVINSMHPAQRKQLFLVIVGMCLSTSYMFEKIERLTVG